MYLDRHVAHDSTLVTFKRLLCNSSDVILTLAQELLTGRLKHLVVLSLNLHLQQSLTHHNTLTYNLV